jgi:hypothetical protein
VKKKANTAERVSSGVDAHYASFPTSFGNNDCRQVKSIPTIPSNGIIIPVKKLIVTGIDSGACFFRCRRWEILRIGSNNMLQQEVDTLEAIMVVNPHLLWPLALLFGPFHQGLENILGRGDQVSARKVSQ